jgi:hypothetical protein
MYYKNVLSSMIIDGISHDKLIKAIRYDRMRKIEHIGLHSFGTIYVRSKYGYVANGYNWYRFKLYDLSRDKNEIINKYL